MENKNQNEIAVAKTAKDLFSQVNVKQRFEEMLGDKAPGFISSVLQVVNNNKLLANAKPVTVLNAAAVAATLDLPINQSLGFAYIVPYRNEAQFQIGYKGFIQLALRSGQYKKINAVPLYENQFKSFNILTEELDADFTLEADGEVVGYVAFIKLLNGFEKLIYWSKIKVINHAKKYSKSYGKSNNGWNDPDTFNAMALKTVIKNIISHYGIMSIEMQTAQLSDQAVIRKENKYAYPDNQIDLEADNQEEINTRVLSFIDAAKSLEDLEKLEDHLTDETTEAFNNKKQFLILE